MTSPGFKVNEISFNSKFEFLYDLLVVVLEVNVSSNDPFFIEMKTMNDKIYMF